MSRNCRDMSPPLSHSDFRSRVCGVCTRKPKYVRPITSNLLELIKKWNQPNYDISVQPSVCCLSCIDALKHVDQHGLNQSRNLPDLEYETFRLPVGTRQQTLRCDCQYCTVGRLSGQQYMKHCKDVVASQGRPPKDPAPKIAPEPVMICQQCQGKHTFIFFSLGKLSTIYFCEGGGGRVC